MQKITCVDTRPMRVSPVGKNVPRTTRQRRELLRKYGRQAFLLPKGTKSNPNRPAYPVINMKGCYHCNTMRAAYTRLGQAIARTGNTRYKAELRNARRKLIKLAHKYANADDRSNTCNFAFKALAKYR